MTVDDGSGIFSVTAGGVLDGVADGSGGKGTGVSLFSAIGAAVGVDSVSRATGVFASSAGFFVGVAIGAGGLLAAAASS